MAKVLPEIDAELAAWMAAQPLFFNATAPLAAAGHVNLTGSGNESAPHLVENGRLTVMFCAFSGPPRILRLYGRGEVVLPGDPAWAELRPLFPDFPGVRQIVRLAVQRVQTSCGAGVPLMDYRGPRDELLAWARNKGEEGMAEYRRQKNAVSIDGLPAPGLDS